jgi:hypothetical protein
MSATTSPALFSLVDLLQKRRRLLGIAAFISVDIWLLTFCSHALESHRSNLTTRIHNTESAQTQLEYQNDVMNGGNPTAGLSHVLDVAEVGVLRATIAAADGVTHAEHGLQSATKTTARITGNGAIAISRTTAHVFTFTGHVAMLPSIEAAHGVGNTVSAVASLSHIRLSSVIQPKKDINAPVITPEQAQQASLIQKDTVAVTPVKPTGSGGLCDAGGGNGGYPMGWCDAPMDTMQTVSYSGDRINRECTSYAFWYFTAIEGHSDFHVTGNANRWAYTSSYPTHATPAIGAIAVETAGAYGHVAIVQALPGQTYDGKVVPAGYVLVSEMNYDWQGHFRYSYSPVSKFSAFIY